MFVKETRLLRPLVSAYYVLSCILYGKNKFTYIFLSTILFYSGEYGRVPGFGFLRLHSTYRHDLKIYASDEGRVQMTAAAFAKVLVVMLSLKTVI